MPLQICAPPILRKVSFIAEEFLDKLSVFLLCTLEIDVLTLSRKKLVVRVYRMGFKALLMGRMNIATHEVTVPGETQVRKPSIRST